jgi:hypothetical protein
MQFLPTICDYLFTGLKFLIPVLFILRIEKLRLRFLNAQALVTAFNITLLIAASTSLISYFIYSYQAYHSGTEQQQYAIINRATGPYWFSFWIPVLIYTLLPHLVWFKKTRNSVKITYTWFSLAFTLSFYIKAVYIIVWLHRDYIPTKIGSIWSSNLIVPSLSEFALSIVTTVISITLAYLIVSKKELKNATV